MTDTAELNYCPCCGYSGLERPAYSRLGSPPWSHPGPPPYGQWYGEPSYEVCHCCGFEFGNDDDPGSHAAPSSFERYLADWIARGCNWGRPEKRPEDWNIVIQFESAGLSWPQAERAEPEIGPIGKLMRRLRLRR